MWIIWTEVLMKGILWWFVIHSCHWILMYRCVYLPLYFISIHSILYYVQWNLPQKEDSSENLYKHTHKHPHIHRLLWWLNEDNWIKRSSRFTLKEDLWYTNEMDMSISFTNKLALHVENWILFSPYNRRIYFQGNEKISLIHIVECLMHVCYIFIEWNIFNWNEHFNWMQSFLFFWLHHSNLPIQKNTLCILCVCVCEFHA